MTDAEDLVNAFDEGAAKEREGIVEWLKQERPNDFAWGKWFAKQIENGEHWK